LDTLTYPVRCFLVSVATDCGPIHFPVRTRANDWRPAAWTELGRRGVHQYGPHQGAPCSALMDDSGRLDWSAAEIPPSHYLDMITR
jgi:hypothetical protein